MKNVYVFKRYEKKYRICAEQKERLLLAIHEHLTPDKHGKSRVMSLYLDTADFRLIRESITAGVYKEKLRLRSYGAPTPQQKIFFEIKKKYKGVVYKRRVSLPLCRALEYIAGGPPPLDSQIMREIDYTMHCYGTLAPRMLICCDREAFFAADDDSVRLTFDNNISFTPNPLGFSEQKPQPVIPPKDIILEVKTAGAMPLWLSYALSECEIFSAPFSKYGTAYSKLNYPIKENPHD